MVFCDNNNGGKDKPGEMAPLQPREHVWADVYFEDRFIHNTKRLLAFPPFRMVSLSPCRIVLLSVRTAEQQNQYNYYCNSFSLLRHTCNCEAPSTVFTQCQSDHYSTPFLCTSTGFSLHFLHSPLNCHLLSLLTSSHTLRTLYMCRNSLDDHSFVC